MQACNPPKVQALQATQLEDQLKAATDPNFKGSIVPLVEGQDTGPIVPNFPW